MPSQTKPTARSQRGSISWRASTKARSRLACRSTRVHRIEPRDRIAAQGQDLPETGNAPGQVTVLASSIAAAGRAAADFASRQGQGGKLVRVAPRQRAHLGQTRRLDQQAQIEPCGWLTSHARREKSEAAFGLLGTAAPRGNPRICSKATWPTTPWSISSRSRRAAAQKHRCFDQRIRKAGGWCRDEASVTSLRLTGIEFD